MPHSSAANTMLCVYHPWIYAKTFESSQWVSLWNATFRMCWISCQVSLCPQVFNFKQGNRQTIAIQQYEVDPRKHSHQCCQHESASPRGVHMVQPSSFGNREEEKFRFFLVRPNELKSAMPPSSRSRPVWQGGISSLVVCQLSVVHHDIDSVKIHQIATLPQDIFKDQLPVGMSDLPGDLIL